MRANANQLLIGDEDDRIDLERLIDRSRTPCRVKIHAFCWLPRELHLAIQVTDHPLGNFIQRVASAYAHRKHRRARTSGHLFAHRYDATPVPRSALTALVRHIHRAPIRNGLTTTATDYRWSSHRAYLGLNNTPWLTTAALNTFGRSRAAAREAFDACVNGNGVRDVEFQQRLDEHEALRRALKKRSHLPLPFESLDRLIESVCRTQAVTIEQLQSRMKHPNADLARALIAWHATRSGLATLTEVADRVGRHPSTLSVAIDRYRITHPHLFRHPRPKPAR